MGAPVATPSDLQTRLRLPTIDNARALAVLEDAQSLFEAIASPAPATARGLIVSVAARAYTNPEQLHDAKIGTAAVGYATAGSVPIGGLYVSRSEEKTYKRLTGRVGAFSADVMPTGATAVQSMLVTAAAGTYTLYFAGLTTVAIAFDADASTVQNALAALGTIGAGNVQVAGSAGNFVITFAGILANTPVPTLIADPTLLTGTVAISVVTVGVLAPGQGLPPWDYDYYNSRHLLGAQVYGYQS